ncbi:exo-beta-1,3-glucanase [Methylomonas methanica]|uniref:Endo-1,3-beta-glucanase btgC n=2 Tax=Methylomonas methanica TaxID=421 RepID=A0A177MHE4_METMH|nr:exo-beta-1,3-glucanase [Methylomonas methanica]
MISSKHKFNRETTKILLCLIFIVFIHGILAWITNLPEDVGVDVPSGRLMSLSFAPFRDGFSPIKQKFPLPEHIDEDLGLLADKTFGIRTYSTLGGMESTPDFARKYGVDMILGGWLGDGKEGNALELEALIKSANAHPDVVKRVIVGNEVLLRNDLDVDSLIGHIREVKQAINQPVSYADVWSIYLRYPQLFNEVDFVSIHILPYWEDEPIGINRAAEHIERIFKQVEDKMLSMGLNKPILIGESGWPGIGRQRGYARPSIVNQTKFIRSMVQVANQHGFDYNLVEAFNQPWKSQHEGVVGANWGLMSIDRKSILSLAGSVSENPNWPMHFALATILWLLIVAAYFKKLRCFSLPRLLLFLALGQAFSVCLVTIANFLWFTSYSESQRAYAIFMVSANAALGGLLMQRFHDILTGKPDDRRLAKLLRVVYLIFIPIALYKTHGLAFDGRTLSFPNDQFAIPVLGVCCLAVCMWIGIRRLEWQTLAFDSMTGGNLHMPIDKLLAFALSIEALALVVGETKAFMNGYDFIQAHPDFMEGLPFALAYTFHNQQLTTWLLCILILAIPFWIQIPRGTRA